MFLLSSGLESLLDTCDHKSEDAEQFLKLGMHVKIVTCFFKELVEKGLGFDFHFGLNGCCTPCSEKISADYPDSIVPVSATASHFTQESYSVFDIDKSSDLHFHSVQFFFFINSE